MWDRLLAIVDMVLSHWKLLMLLFFAGGIGHFAEDGIGYAQKQLNPQTEIITEEQAQVERGEVMPVDCPDLSCPKCPDVKLSCPEISTIKHEKEYHE